jgi:hypothetical protein
MRPIAAGSSSNVVMNVTDITAVLYIDLVVMNNTTAGLATGGDHLGYHVLTTFTNNGQNRQ